MIIKTYVSPHCAKRLSERAGKPISDGINNIKVKQTIGAGKRGNEVYFFIRTNDLPGVMIVKHNHNKRSHREAQYVVATYLENHMFNNNIANGWYQSVEMV